METSKNIITDKEIELDSVLKIKVEQNLPKHVKIQEKVYREDKRWQLYEDTS